MIAIVHTQPDCVFCTRVKSALRGAGFDIDERDIGPVGSEEREVFKMFHATTPQVFIGDRHIGSYEETVAWLQANLGRVVNGRW